MKKLPRYPGQCRISFADKMSKTTQVIVVNNSSHNLKVTMSVARYMRPDTDVPFISAVSNPLAHRSYTLTPNTVPLDYKFCSNCSY